MSPSASGQGGGLPFAPPSADERVDASPSPAPYDDTVAPWTRFDPDSMPPGFVPLRTDPPPNLLATWWVRYMLFLAQLVGVGAVLLTEYAEGPGGVFEAPVVLVPYALTMLLVVVWSALAMVDAARLVPGTRYHPRSRASVVTVLWLLAFVAPVAAVRVVVWAQDRLDEDAAAVGGGSADAWVVSAMILAVLVCFLLVWSPFRYHVRQAQRIGAAPRVMQAWFWLPLLAAVGALLIDALGLRETLEEDGFTDLERTIELGVVFGLPALVMALATWRATTVFDEVIDIRWRRWKHEWEQTIAAMTAQPPPPPEPPV